MARSISYWQNIMIAEKNTMSNLNALQPNIDSSQTLLNDLQSTSKVARWRLLFWCVACCAYALDVLFDSVIVMLSAIAAKSRYGTLAWYVSVAKQFQYGDSLVLQDLQWIYATVNTANQIVMLAAAQENDTAGRVNLKIATIVGGVTQKLTAPQFAAFQGYMKKIKPAGVQLNIINSDPDDLILNLSINYDPLVLSSTGELIATPGTFPVNDQITAYMQGLDFDGAFELMKLIDSIQQATGVVSAYVNDAQARYGLNPFVSFTQRYFPNAGYLTLNPSTITYNAI